MMSRPGAGSPITTHIKDNVTLIRRLIFVSTAKDLYLPLQVVVFANVDWFRVSSRDGVTSFNIGLI
jgi:hypothetical protein